MKLIDFNKSKYQTKYSFNSPRQIVRILSDSFSKQFCDHEEAIKYASENTQGCCLYCGERLYKLKTVDGVQGPHFEGNIHYDHIYPASKLNLFEVGNIALSCESCNLSKSDRDPIEYYEIRSKEEEPLFIESKEEFVTFLNIYTKPYREKWPEHYEAGLEDLDEEDFKEKLTDLLYEPISLERANTKYNHKTSVNKHIWTMLVEDLYETYDSENTRNDVINRIGYANYMLETLYGTSTHILDLDKDEVLDLSNKIIVSKSESSSEVQKYRMLLRILLGVLNEETNGKYEDVFDNVLTYGMLKKDSDL